MSRSRIYRTISFIIIICSSFIANGQTSGLTTGFSHADSLRQDFNFFRDNMIRKYPSLYRYSDKIKMDHLFNSSYNSIHEGTSDLEFYKTIKILLSQIKDGHLYCSLPPDIEKYRAEKALFFPVELRFINRKGYVYLSPGSQIPAGSEIISINQRPFKKIIAELFKYIVSDGNIETKKYRILNDYFYFYYFIAFGETTYFDVDYKLADGQIKKTRIKADLEKNIIKDNNDDSRKPLLDFAVKPHQIALITIKTFDRALLKVDFNAFLKDTFKKIKELHIEKLIIDLRGNGGGRDTYGSILYSYLANKPFKYYSSLQTVSKELDYDKFRSDISSYNDLTPSMVKNIGNDQYVLAEEAHPNLKTIYPVGHYIGKVLFIIDGLSFSTTAEFCAIAYSNKRGDFVGEETGGTYEGNTSGVQADLMLPNTKMEVSFGTVKYKMSVNNGTARGRGIIPKYKFQPTIQDLIHKKDTGLAYAIELANQKSN